jgi:hypothetical protein
LAVAERGQELRERREHLVGGLLGEEVADIGMTRLCPARPRSPSGLTTKVLIQSATA